MDAREKGINPDQSGRNETASNFEAVLLERKQGLVLAKALLLVTTNPVKFHVLGHYIDEDLLMLNAFQERDEGGVVSINFIHKPSSKESHEKKVGVRTSNILAVNSSDSEETSIDDPMTYYLVDENGKYAKVVTQTRDNNNQQDDLEIEGFKILDKVSMQVPFSAEDFEIAESALLALESELDNALSGA